MAGLRLTVAPLLILLSNVISYMCTFVFSVGIIKRYALYGWPPHDRSLAALVSKRKDDATLAYLRAKDASQGDYPGHDMPDTNTVAIGSEVLATSDFLVPLPTVGDTITNTTEHYANNLSSTFDPFSSIPQSLPPAMLSILEDIISQGRDLMSPMDLDLSVSALANIQTPVTPPSLTENHLPGDASITTGRVFQARTEYAARRLAAQACALAETGQTAFIHHTQVSASAVLRDALAASALHRMRNTANAAIVRREISRRASLLVGAVGAAINSPLIEVDLLPPVQALLIYQCIRLFSICDLTEQAQAERDEAPLQAWAERLRMQIHPFEDEKGWLSWIRAESVRRAVVFAEVVSGVYSFLKFGWDRAEVRMGQLGFTAQASLWKAQSAAEWRNAWSNRPRLEVSMSTFGHDIEEAKPDDLDDLGIIVRASYSGLEALEEWFDGDLTTLRRWGLRS